MKKVIILLAILAFSAFGMEKEQPSKRQRVINSFNQKDIISEINAWVASVKAAWEGKSWVETFNKQIKHLIPSMVEHSEYFNIPVVFNSRVLSDIKNEKSFLIYFLNNIGDRLSSQGYEININSIDPNFIECLRNVKITPELQALFIEAIKYGKDEFMQFMLTIYKDLLDSYIDGETPFSILEKKIAAHKKNLAKNSRLSSVKEALLKNEAALKVLRDAFAKRERARKQQNIEEFNKIQVDRIMDRMNRASTEDNINFILRLNRS